MNQRDAVISLSLALETARKAVGEADRQVVAARQRVADIERALDDAIAGKIPTPPTISKHGTESAIGRIFRVFQFAQVAMLYPSDVTRLLDGPRIPTATIRQCLVRLVADGLLIRVARGGYALASVPL